MEAFFSFKTISEADQKSKKTLKIDNIKRKDAPSLHLNMELPGYLADRWYMRKNN
jgi:hypothetical protein